LLVVIPITLKLILLILIVFPTASAMTEMVKDKPIKYALKLTRDDVSDYLDGLPEQKIKCSNFSIEVLKKALKTSD